MALWCRNVPTVHVPESAAPKAVTLIVPYYENPRFFARQLATWAAYPASLKQELRVIVVDDGSPEHPAADVARPPHLPALRLFRIGTDVRWNWLAARNIGFYHALDGWCLVTDMDHVLPAETLTGLVWGRHDPERAYAFARRDAAGTPLAPHSASFFLTRLTFWKTGGYDETLSGHYGTDGEFRRRLSAVAKFALLPSALERHEYEDDASTTRYKRKQPEDAEVRKLVAGRRAGWAPRVLSFPYEEVAC